MLWFLRPVLPVYFRRTAQLSVAGGMGLYLLKRNFGGERTNGLIGSLENDQTAPLAGADGGKLERRKKVKPGAKKPLSGKPAPSSRRGNRAAQEDGENGCPGRAPLEISSYSQ